MRRKLLLIVLAMLLLPAQSMVERLALSPDRGEAGQTLEVTTSIPLSADGTIRFEPAGLITGNLRNERDGRLRFMLQIPPNAAPGKYAVIYQGNPPIGAFAPAPSIRMNDAFTVVAPRPVVVRAIRPDSVTAGEPAIAVEITGAGFNRHASVSFSGAGVSAGAVSVSPAGDSITTTVRATADASAGPRNVIVTNPDGMSNSAQTPPVTLNVIAVAAPTVAWITPAEAAAGSPAFEASVRGANFQPGAELTIDGVNVLQTAVARDRGTIAARLLVPATTPPGPRPVVVTNPDGRSTRTAPPVMFTVTPAQPPPVPVVRQVTPDTFNAGAQNTPVAITGANFAPGASVRLGDGTGQFTNVTVASDNRIDALFSVAGNASGGPRAVIVTNPDGGSNVAQAPPVNVTIVAQPGVPRGRPSAPPTTPPPATPPPVVPPPTTQPPVVTPPVVTPPAITPPPVTPPVTQPPAQQPPGITPGRPVIPKPPTELLLGPRIDLVTPATLAPGDVRTIEFQGKNFTNDMKVSFGRGFTVSGVFISSPTTGSLKVQVAPSVTPGAYAAQASNREGANSGPGGIFIGSKLTSGTKPETMKPPDVAVKPTFKQPYGEIILDAPCDVNDAAKMGNVPGLGDVWYCKETPMLLDETTFQWHEANPGIASFFVLELVDGSGKVIFSAQTKQTHYRLSPANLASLPRIDPPPASLIAGSGAPGHVAGVVSQQGQKQTSNVSASAQKAKQQFPPGDVKAVVAAVNANNATRTNGANASKASGHKLAAGEVFWRVRGMSNKLHPVLGTPTSEMIQSEKSEERPILLPLPPNGLSCDNGTAGSTISVAARYSPPLFQLALAFGGKVPERPKPCEGDSPNICSDVDLAEFTEDSHINVKRLPFDIQQFGSTSGPVLAFGNVWIDWGDGSEPEVVMVKGDLKNHHQSLSSLRLYKPGADENRHISHRYHNENKEADFVEYHIRIYAIADADTTTPASVAAHTKTGAKASGAAGGGQKGSTGGKGSSTAANTANTASKTPSADAAAKNYLSSIFTIACATARIHNPHEAGIDEPVDLISARIVFSTEPDAPQATKGGSSGKPVVANPAPGKTGAAQAGAVPPNKSGAAQVASSTPDKSGSSQAGPATVSPPKGGATSFTPPGSSNAPEISDCSLSFKAGVKVIYSGQGYIRVDWKLHGETIESAGPVKLDPVSFADAASESKPVVLMMADALPAELQPAMHEVKAVVMVVAPPEPPPPPSGKGTKPSATDPAKTQAQQQTVAATQHSNAQVNQVVTTGGRSANVNPNISPVFTTIAMPELEAIETPARYYRVFDHKARNLPCSIRYVTTETGTFTISDITELKRTGATYSGSGVLQLMLPSLLGDSLSIEPVPITFTGWKLELVDGAEDFYDVVEGSIDKKLQKTLKPLSFELALSKVALTPERLALTGTLGVSEAMGFTNATKKELPEWTLTAVPLTADGELYSEIAKPLSTDLGASGFGVNITNSVIDFSPTRGEGPVQSCATTAKGTKWQGVKIDGTLSAPDALQINNVSLLKDYDFKGWGIGPYGLDVSFTDSEYKRAISTKGVKVTVTELKFGYCNGALASPSFRLDIENAPLLVQKVSGKVTLDEYLNVHPEFKLSKAVTHDWGNVKVEITDAQFVWKTSISAFALEMKSHAWFKANGKPAYDAAYDDILVTLAGNVFNGAGEHYWPAPSGGSANIGGFPMQVTQLGIGNDSNGDIWFGFLGDIEAGSEAPSAENKEAKFVLRYSPVASLEAVAPWLVASNGELIAPEMFAMIPGYSSSDADGVKIEKFKLDWTFPPGSQTVHLIADCEWQSAENRFFFVGQGEVVVLDTVGVGVDVLFGREVNDSYWLLRASVTLPTMIQLGSTPFGLKRIEGGLAYSVPISAFDMHDLRLVKTDKSKAYLFSAGVDVGTLDEFLLYGRGRLTIKLGGPDAGFRIGMGVWFITSDHSGAPMGESCVQYAGGAFDAGATANISFADGLISISAPQKGPDVCIDAATRMHFAGASDWFVSVGQQDAQLSVYFLYINAHGFLKIDPEGVIVHTGVGVDKYWGVDLGFCNAYVRMKQELYGRGQLQFDPIYIHATVGGNAHYGAGACGVDVGVGGGVSFSGGAPPLSLCGSIHVEVEIDYAPDVGFTLSACI